MGFECSLAFVFRERERGGNPGPTLQLILIFVVRWFLFSYIFFFFLVFSGGCSHAESYHLSDLLGQEAQPTLDFNLDGLRAY